MLFAFHRNLYRLIHVPYFNSTAYGRGATVLRSSGSAFTASALNRGTFPPGARYTYMEFLRPAVGFIRRTMVKPHSFLDRSSSRTGAFGCRREMISCIFLAPHS